MKGDDDLQDKNQWDFDHAQELPPERPPRAIVSVAFSATDFSAVSMAAEASGMKVSTFIRDAAVDRARHSVTIVELGTLPSVQTNIRFPTNWVDRREEVVSSATAVL